MQLARMWTSYLSHEGSIGVPGVVIIYIVAQAVLKFHGH